MKLSEYDLKQIETDMQSDDLETVRAAANTLLDALKEAYGEVEHG
jgi:hypothetical protein